MRYLNFNDSGARQYPVCFLVTQINKDEIQKEYIKAFNLDPNEILVIDLHQAEGKKKTPMSEMKAYIEEELQEVLDQCGVEYLLIADADYFRAFSKQSKVEANLGCILDSSFGKQKILYVPSYKAIFYDPEAVRTKITRSINALIEYRSGSYKTPGIDIIHFAEYPKTVEEIEAWMEKLLALNKPLAIDTETFTLKHHTAGIGTISFAWSKHEGIAFPVDYEPIRGAKEAPFGKQIRNEPVRKILQNFFRKYISRAIYHSISFDVYVLIYQLFMEDLLDTEGLLEGLEVMLGGDWDDTKLITYFATNSCAGNDLSLKYQAQEFAGNWAKDNIEDITLIPLDELLQYNLVDSLSTWFVFEKHWPTVIADEQQEIYEGLFKPCMWDIIQMQLTGMPVNMERAKEVSQILNDERDILVSNILSCGIVKSFEKEFLDVQHAEKRNAKLKQKRILPGEEPQTLNPNSDPQIRDLLFNYLELPVINLTDNKLPSTDGESIEALLNRTENPEIKYLLENLQLFTIISTLTSTFIPAILNAAKAPDGWHYLFGNFNLGGTLSGRLSSSGPNLQNLPSTGKGHPIKLRYAKLIKSCFQAPPGWLFCGIDFSSLEDRISALTTKDPNKLAVYQGHIVYELDVDGVIHHIRDDDTIIYDGVSYRGQELYRKLASNS
jgi:DNA polymerase-1